MEEKQVQTSLERTTFDPQGHMVISVHLMLAAEQQHLPTLTLHKIWVELIAQYQKTEVPRPKEWYAQGSLLPLGYAPVTCARP